MSWNDDSWKDGYDAWKLASPYDEDAYDLELECEHENYEIDVCTGRAECDYCSHYWYLTNEEIDAELDRQAHYHDDMEREERLQWWRDKTYLVRMFIFRILERVWPKKAHKVLDDSDLPF